MISLEGLTLSTGRYREAGVHPAHVRALRARRADPEHVSGRRARGPVPHRRRDAVVLPCGRIATSRVTGDTDTLRTLLPTLRRHRPRITCAARGSASASTRTTACCGRAQQGYQLTWMDAKVDDWVVTPRRGKAVEINALWYNALRLLTAGSSELGERRRARAWPTHAERARDVVQRALLVRRAAATSTTSSTASTATTPACRPNQVFAISLDHPVLDAGALGAGDGRRAGAAADARRPALARARASRTTRRSTTAICASRDAAYHQGTVWAWLIGPFVDAWLKVYPEDRAGARAAARRFRRASERSVRRLDQRDLRCRGSLRPRGCIAQAWSVAEVLRWLLKTADGTRSGYHSSTGETGRTADARRLRAPRNLPNPGAPRTPRTA